MEDSNTNANAKAPAADGEQNPTNSPPNEGDGAAEQRRRTPFTDLSQVDADLALARTLQEQVFLNWALVFFSDVDYILYWIMFLVLIT